MISVSIGFRVSIEIPIPFRYEFHNVMGSAMLLKSITIFAMLFFSNISRGSQVFKPLGYFTVARLIITSHTVRVLPLRYFYCCEISCAGGVFKQLLTAPFG